MLLSLVSFNCTAVSTPDENVCHSINHDVPLRAIMFQPHDKLSEFWRASRKFAEAVARDLNIELKTIVIEESRRNRFGFKELILDTLTTDTKPDFILSVLYGGGEYSQLTAFNREQVPFFTFNSSLGPDELRQLSVPRKKFKYWKGHTSPDELGAGAKMVTELMKVDGGKTIAILAGARNSVVNNHRVEGALRQSRKESLSILSPIFTDWSVEHSVRATKALLNRVPDIDIIWTAGPETALGASVVLSVMEKRAALASFDWTETNARMIEDGALQFSLGGHFTEAGWAVVLMHDLLHGRDFDDEKGTIILSELKKMDRTNVEQIKSFVLAEKWDKIDFAEYSKCLTPGIEKYDFTLPIQQP